MSVFFSLIYLLLFIFSLVLIKILYKTFATPLTIFTITFLFFPFIVTLRPLGLYELSFKTHLLIILSFCTFFIFSLLFSKSKRKTNLFSKNFLPASTLNYWLLIIVNVLIFVYLIPKVISAWGTIQSNGWTFLRNNYEENYSSSTIDNIIYIWFIKTFLIASIAVLSFDIFNNKNKLQIPAVIITLFNVLVDVVLFAARAMLVRLVFYLFFSFSFCKIKKYSKQKIITIGIMSIIIFVILAYVSRERMSESYSSFSMLDTAVMYYCAPYSLLDYYVKNPSFSHLGFDGLQFGTATFGFLYNIIRSGMYVVFGLEYNGSDYIITQVTSETVRVGSSVSINSACTSIYIFLRDFGIVGVLFGFAFCAFLANRSRHFFLSKPSTRSAAIYIIFLYFVMRLSSTYDMLSPGFAFTILFIFVLTINRKKKMATLSI